jgi:hypothetical protein
MIMNTVVTLTLAVACLRSCGLPTSPYADGTTDRCRKVPADRQ